MNIIIEGVDNAGKSSLIEHLMPYLIGSVVHRGFDADAQSVLAKQVDELSPTGNTCYDRSAVISGYIYDLVLGRTPVVKFNLDSVAEVCENTIVILCKPPLANCLATDKDEMPGVVDNHTKLFDAYGEVFYAMKNTYEVPFFTYDYTRNKPDDVVEYIISRLTSHNKELEA